MTPKEKQLTEEMLALLDNIRQHTDNVSTTERTAKLELEVIVEKIEHLHQKAVVLSYLSSHAEEMFPEGTETTEQPEAPEPAIVAATPEPEQETVPIPEPEPVMSEPEPQPDIEALQTDLAATSQSVNETTPADQGSLADKLEKQAASDLKQFIGLNEKILFTKELFGDSSSEYDAAVDHINGLHSMEQVHAYLSSYEWNKENEAVASFLQVVEKRFH